jgi:hypothetical protein
MANNTLGPNQSLKPGEFLTSTNGSYQFILQGDGNLVLYVAGRPLWSSGTAGKTVSQCIMQGDGNLVIYDGLNSVWSSGTAGNPNSFLLVQDDGNVVIYQQIPKWTTNTNV